LPHLTQIPQVRARKTIKTSEKAGSRKELKAAKAETEKRGSGIRGARCAPAPYGTVRARSSCVREKVEVEVLGEGEEGEEGGARPKAKARGLGFED